MLLETRCARFDRTAVMDAALLYTPDGRYGMMPAPERVTGFLPATSYVYRRYLTPTREDV